MAQYKDLSRCEYFDREGANLNLLAVGWLEDLPTKSKEKLPRGFIPKLKKLIAETEEIWKYMGWHDCTLCERTSPRLKVDDHPTSWKNIIVPSAKKIFVCPELIVHYIQDHGYVPPKCFVDAVMDCPRYGTDEYWKPVKKLEPKLWMLELVRRDEMEYEELPWIKEAVEKAKIASEKAEAERAAKRLPYNELVAKLQGYFMERVRKLEDFGEPLPESVSVKRF